MRYALVLLTALLVTAASAPVVRAILLRHNILDVPNHRSSHATPTPRAGGLACLLGAVAAAGVAVILGLTVSWIVVTGALALAAVGFADDWLSLPALPRLGAQAVCGAVVGLTLNGPGLALVGAGLYPLIVNVVNFMDGINGISGAVLTVWGVAALIAAFSGLQPLIGLGVLGCLATGTALGFLPWNLPRARLFLGDSGSYFIGALIAGGVLLGGSQGAPPAVLLAPLALYLGDVALTLVRRKRRGEPLMEAHREHAYQRLVSAAGMSHAFVALIVAGASTVVLVAWLLLPPAGSVTATAAVVALFLALPTLTERAS